MTRAHAARKLLEHGPLTVSEFALITGWKFREYRKTIHALLEAGDVRIVNIDGARHYALAA